MCLYTDNMQYELYYRSLLPVDLDAILKEKKEDQKSISFEIYQINKGQKNAITNICLNFIKNSKRQIKAEIKDVKEIKNIREINTEYIGRNQDEFFKALLENKLYTYAIDENNKSFVIPKYKDTAIYINQKIYKNISIDEKLYYTDYILQRQKDGESIIIGNRITLNFQNNKIKFDFSNNLNDKIKALELFIDMQEKQKITINGATIHIPRDNKINLSEYKKELGELKSIRNMFEKFGINFSENLDKLSKEDWHNLHILTNIFEKNIKPEKTFINQTGICRVKIGKTIILLWIDVEKNKYYSFFEDLSNIVLISRTQSDKQPTKEDEISPYLLLIDKEIMGDEIGLFEYANWNSEIVKKSFEKVKRYKELSPYINEFILYLLLTYDKNKKRKDLLELSQFLCEKLLKEKYEDPNTIFIYKINYFQIIKRKRNFENLENKEIYELKEEVEKIDDYMLKCGISILLDNDKDFKYYFNKLSQEDRDNFIKFPIYNLYNKV